MRMYIVRGLPGSGKSTYANSLAHDTGAVHCEADQYFMRDGEYRFDASKLAEAHADCLERAKRAMHEGKPAIVSNTFTRLWEMAPYFIAAREYGYTVEVVEMYTQYGSIHNVPEYVVQRMRRAWQDIDPGTIRQFGIKNVTCITG